MVLISRVSAPRAVLSRPCRLLAPSDPTSCCFTEKLCFFLPGLKAKGKGEAAGQQVPEGSTAGRRLCCPGRYPLPEERVSVG